MHDYDHSGIALLQEAVDFASKGSVFQQSFVVFSAGVFLLTKASEIIVAFKAMAGWSLDLQAAVSISQKLCKLEMPHLLNKDCDLSVPSQPRWVELSTKLACIEQASTKRFASENRDDIQMLKTKQRELAFAIKLAIQHRLANKFPSLGKALDIAFVSKDPLTTEATSFVATCFTEAAVGLPSKLNFAKIVGPDSAASIQAFVTSAVQLLTCLACSWSWFAKVRYNDSAVDVFDLQGLNVLGLLKEETCQDKKDALAHFDIVECVPSFTAEMRSDAVYDVAKYVSMQVRALVSSSGKFIEGLCLGWSHKDLLTADVVGEADCAMVGFDFKRAVKVHFATLCPTFKFTGGTSEIDARSACLAALILPACKHAVHLVTELEKARQAPTSKSNAATGVSSGVKDRPTAMLAALDNVFESSKVSSLNKLILLFGGLIAFLFGSLCDSRILRLFLFSFLYVLAKAFLVASTAVAEIDCPMLLRAKELLKIASDESMASLHSAVHLLTANVTTGLTDLQALKASTLMELDGAVEPYDVKRGVELSSSPAAAEYYVLYTLVDSTIKSHLKIIASWQEHVFGPGGTLADTKFHNVLTDTTAYIEKKVAEKSALRTTMANMTAFQALGRVLKPGEVRAAQATKCLRGLMTKSLPIAPSLKLKLEEAAGPENIEALKKLFPNFEVPVSKSKA
jgi:hypothetical protein